MDWQPIETAPKTSKARLVWCPERENIYEVTWSDIIDAWIFFGGDGRLWEEPTMWQPLPAPPDLSPPILTQPEDSKNG